MTRISGRHIRKAMVERRRAKRFSPPRAGTARLRSTASFQYWAVCAMWKYPRIGLLFRLGDRARRPTGPARRSEATAGSGAEGAFEFALGPLDHVVELLFALRELGDHHRIDRLIVDLRANL